MTETKRELLVTPISYRCLTEGCAQQGKVGKIMLSITQTVIVAPTLLCVTCTKPVEISLTPPAELPMSREVNAG